MEKYRLNFGRYAGKTLAEVEAMHPGYLDYLARSPYKEAREAVKIFLSKLAASAQEPEWRLTHVMQQLLMIKERPYLDSYALAIDANVYQNDSVISLLLSDRVSRQAIIIIERDEDFPLNFIETFEITTTKKDGTYIGRKSIANVEEEVWYTTCGGFVLYRHPRSVEGALDAIEYYLSNKWR